MFFLLRKKYILESFSHNEHMLVSKRLPPFDQLHGSKKGTTFFYDGNKEGLPNAYELTGMPIFTGFDTLSLNFLISNFHHIILMTKVE